MFRTDRKDKARKARLERVRRYIHGTAAKPRLSVFKSLNHVYAQLIDDDQGVTLLAASSLADEIGGKGKEQASAVGKLLAERAVQKGIQQAVFDRGSYRYHGVIKELADAARTAGLKF